MLACMLIISRLFGNLCHDDHHGTMVWLWLQGHHWQLLCQSRSCTETD